MYDRLLMSKIAMLHVIKGLSDNVAENTNKLPRKNRWKRIAIAYLNKYLEFEIHFKQLILNGKGEIKNEFNLFNSEIVYKLLRKMDEIHELIDAETETTLINNSVISKSLLLRIHYEVIYSPELKYLCRINAPHIIVEGPDRSGKSTLINHLNRFFNSSRKLFYNIFTEMQHVTEVNKTMNKLFLDLSTQEDRLLFQNSLFNRINRNIYNRNRFPIYYEQIMIMDRSLLSNLIYSYVMLDKDHFRKYLFNNYRLLSNCNINFINDGPINTTVPSTPKKRPVFTFVEPIKMEFPKGNQNITSSNYTKTDFKTNNPFDNEDDMIDLNNAFNNDVVSSYIANETTKSSSIVSSLYKKMREYTLNVLYVKNTVYSFNKLDEIEKNVRQEKIVDLFSIFKDVSDIYELKRRVISSDESINKIKTFEEKDYSYSYNIANLIIENIKASFDLVDNRYDYKVSIIYDDDKEKSSTETFDNCIEKLIEINEKMYLDELTNLDGAMEDSSIEDGEVPEIN